MVPTAEQSSLKVMLENSTDQKARGISQLTPLIIIMSIATKACSLHEYKTFSGIKSDWQAAKAKEKTPLEQLCSLSFNTQMGELLEDQRQSY